MKRVRSRVGGYTIIETLIFLGISGALAVSAILLMNGQQQRTSFAQSVREMELIIQDILNDVSTGYFDIPQNVACTINGAGQPVVTGTGTGLGTGGGCVLMGRVVQFRGDTSNNAKYRTYTIVGRRQVSPGVLASTLSDANPTIIPSSVYVRDDVTPHTYDVKFQSSVTQRAIVILYTNSPGYAANGTSKVEVKPLDIGDGASEGTVKTKVEALTTASPSVPGGGFKICMGNGSQKGSITIGGNNQQFTTSSLVGDSTCP